MESPRFTMYTIDDCKSMYMQRQQTSSRICRIALRIRLRITRLTICRMSRILSRVARLLWCIARLLSRRIAGIAWVTSRCWLRRLIIHVRVVTHWQRWNNGIWHGRLSCGIRCCLTCIAHTHIYISFHWQQLLRTTIFSIFNRPNIPQMLHVRPSPYRSSKE